MKDLSIIISCRNEVVGTIITMRSALEEFKSGIDGEVIICDNSDDRAYMRSIRGKTRESEWLDEGSVKFLGQSYPCIFTARELAIRHSNAKYILIVDSHCIFGHNSLINMLKSAEKDDKRGFTYGLMCFSRDHELESFCDRDIETFLGIRLFRYPHKPDEFEIPFRGMPFMCKRSFFDSIGGYGALSKHRLSWGGGDFILGMKSSMMGYRNVMTKNATVIHLGPFKNSKYFPTSFIRESGRGYPVRFGMLVAAYIVGGEQLLTTRIQQLSDRLGFDQLSGEDIDRAIAIGNEDRKWLLEKAKFSYSDLINKFKFLQTQAEASPIGRVPLPPMSGTLEEKGIKITERRKPLKNFGFRRNSWQSRIINQDRFNLKQSGAQT